MNKKPQAYDRILDQCCYIYVPLNQSGDLLLICHERMRENPAKGRDKIKLLKLVHRIPQFLQLPHKTGSKNFDEEFWFCSNSHRLSNLEIMTDIRRYVTNVPKIDFIFCL